MTNIFYDKSNWRRAPSCGFASVGVVLYLRRTFVHAFSSKGALTATLLFCEALDIIVYFCNCFPFARCCDCTSLFFLGNQTEIALQPILLFQANYLDTLKATIKIISLAVPLYSESSLTPEQMPRLFSASNSKICHSSCGILRHKPESQILLLLSIRKNIEL